MKRCTATSCAAKGIEVKTDAKDCLMCGKPLTEPFKDIFSDLGLGGLFGK
jgi:hypothetical protein